MDLGVFSTAAEFYVGSIAAIILLIATNAGIIGVSRLTYSMGQYQQLPDQLRRISPRSRTPATAIALFGVLSCLVIIPGEAEFLGTMYAFGAMLSFTIGHASLVGLRWRLARSKMVEIPGDVRIAEEQEAGWYRAPFNMRMLGVEIPLFAVVGGLGTFSAWVAVMVLYPQALVAGWAWLLLGITTYVVYRRRKGLPLRKTRKIKLPPYAGVEPVSYAGVVVAFEEATYSETALATALKLASQKRGDLRVIVTVNVPQHLSLDAPLPEVEATAQAIIEAARQWAGRRQRIKGQVAKVRPGEAGHRIVREAMQLRADAIVMPMPHQRPPGKLLNRTLETVLGKRPCRVIIDSVAARPFTLSQAA
jgi:APA family basic amino acid/polyamine antiporter